jgi:hypothetical protein
MHFREQNILNLFSLLHVLQIYKIKTVQITSGKYYTLYIQSSLIPNLGVKYNKTNTESQAETTVRTLTSNFI